MALPISAHMYTVDVGTRYLNAMYILHTCICNIFVVMLEILGIIVVVKFQVDTKTQHA